MQINELPPISVDETARFFAISPRSVRRLVDRGELRPTRIGGTTLFRWTDVLRTAGIRGDASENAAPPPLLTLHEAAERLGCAPRTVRAMIECGNLPPIRVGSLLRLRMEDVVHHQERDGSHAPHH